MVPAQKFQFIKCGKPPSFRAWIHIRFFRQFCASPVPEETSFNIFISVPIWWTDIIWGGTYPTYGTPSWVVSDKHIPNNTVGDIEFGEQEGEVVDKILYINDPQSDVRIFAKKYKRDMNYIDLADHVPVVVEFGYEKVN